MSGWARPFQPTGLPTALRTIENHCTINRHATPTGCNTAPNGDCRKWTAACSRGANAATVARLSRATSSVESSGSASHNSTGKIWPQKSSVVVKAISRGAPNPSWAFFASPNQTWPALRYMRHVARLVASQASVISPAAR